MSLHLVIGNKNYSSWSFRPWLAMKVAGIAFDETVISLDAADFKTRVMALGGSGRVPVLSDDDVRIWESLAILEYLAEKFPAAGLWPERPAARAQARAIAAEMHAGFVSLRRHLPMNVARPVKFRALDAGAAKDVARIDAIWGECRSEYGSGGPPVWLLRRRRRHVCSCRVALSYLRSWGELNRARFWRKTRSIGRKFCANRVDVNNNYDERHDRRVGPIRLSSSASSGR